MAEREQASKRERVERSYLEWVERKSAAAREAKAAADEAERAHAQAQREKRSRRLMLTAYRILSLAIVFMWESA